MSAQPGSSSPPPWWVKLAADAALVAAGLVLLLLVPGQAGDLGGGAALGAGIRGLYALS